jgi:flagellar biosynthesis/type III secretory pathway chaperone
MSADYQSFADLIALLEEEAGIYSELADLLTREREALLRLAASEIAEICSQKETLGLRVKALDESRRLLSDRMGRRYGLHPDMLTVTELLRFAPADLAAKLDGARTRLRERANLCKEINEYNSRAARRGLDLVSGAMDHLLNGADPAGKVYQKQGGYGRNARRTAPAVVSHQA